ncbi:acetyl-CoA C-acetyltransferase [Thermocatellispora tengchongensis]|uniref:Acetyl-CoA C-acetyltransferase n=2 Tax=Thermocatellispora tengchongensis TaxID=1073253 RepID=A0A840PAP7_9ACTN|nr:acetyl-CoA acetyltransferase [Thermocatellispora tengchongensis]MBB5136079.1 acetyl-CoA C-acetyltransferase [Thermocatellispora tengchongensis]
MTTPIFVLGGEQSDFRDSWTTGGGGLHDLMAYTVAGALERTRLDPAAVQTAHVTNFAGEVFNHQAQLGGFVNRLYPEWADLPTSRHEAACASGSIGVLAAMAELQAGRYDCALVVGAEIMRHVGGQTAARRMGIAAWHEREVTDDRLPWPGQFSDIADAYAERHGLAYPHLARIAEVNLGNAKRNPRAQTRSWTFEPGAFTCDDTLNPVVAGMLRKQDCGRITDGAAAVVLAGEPFARRWARERGIALSSVARVRGWGHRGAPILLAEKLRLGATQKYLFPHLRRAITDAYARAGLAGPGDLDVIETHDCFTITEYVAIDHFGITEPGAAWQAVEDDVITREGRLPVNPSGGLIGLGHPVGATGVRMVLDAQRQVTGTAGDYQIDGATTAATLNIGGSFTTVVGFVIGT